MAFLWGSATSTQFDQLVEQCTSDLLPAKSPLDLDAALRLADAVRSASVPPSEAALKLVTRLGHDNPNVQLLALQLADVLVKNAGNQFLKAFASNAATGGAVNELEHLCSSSSSETTTANRSRPPVNRDVQLAARQKLQEWASAFEASGRPLLSQSDLVKLYHRLRSTPNVPFPAPVDATTTAAMVDSLSAPDWSDSPYCTRCRTEFSTFNRKHHCRNCGNVFDQQCSSQRMPLPHYGITTESVRVCDACAKQIKQGKGAQVARTILQQQQQQADTSSSSGAKTTMTRRVREEEEDDADLQRAIQASLAESTSAASHGPARSSPPLPSSSGYHPSYASQIQSSSDSKQGKKEEEEEEDPDLAAAIAASLKDLEASSSSRPRASAPSASAPAQTYSDLFPSDNRATAAAVPKTGAFHLASYDLTPAEHSHLSQFLLSSQLDPSSSSSSSAYPASTATNEESYRLVSEVLQPKLDRSLRDARTRAQILREMEAKLSEAARLYGAGLTERVQRQEQPQAYRSSSSSYSIPTASASASSIPYPTPYQDPATLATTRYQYAPPTAAVGVGYGQPLPAYAVPAVVAPPSADAASASVAPSAQQQQQEYAAAAAAAAALPPPQQQQQPQQQQPAGFYKPSQFPPVPQTDPTPNPHYSQSVSVLGLPNVPRENPWNTNDASDRRREEAEAEEEEAQQKVGELIEL